MKEERREKRKVKKELKLAFKNHMTKEAKRFNVEEGQIKPGVSIRRID